MTAETPTISVTEERKTLKTKTFDYAITKLYRVDVCALVSLYRIDTDKCINMLFFFQALSFVVESSGLLNDLFPRPSILDAGYPVFDLHLADVVCDVILPSVLRSSL